MGTMAIKNLIEKMEQAKKDFIDSGKKELSGAFKEVFEQFPAITGIRWAQHTPYFNDGEACVFSVGEFYIQFDNNEEDGDYDDGFLSSYDLEDNDPRNKAFELLDPIQKAEEILEATFGDHQQITAVLNNGKVKFEAEEYEHD